MKLSQKFKEEFLLDYIKNNHSKNSLLVHASAIDALERFENNLNDKFDCENDNIGNEGDIFSLDDLVLLEDVFSEWVESYNKKGYKCPTGSAILLKLKVLLAQAKAS